MCTQNRTMVKGFSFKKQKFAIFDYIFNRAIYYQLAGALNRQFRYINI